MITQSIFLAGIENEVRHHVEPLLRRLPIEINTHEQILSKVKPADLVIFTSEHFDRSRNTIRELKSKQVATLYLIDGILEWRNAWENEPHEPACPWAMRPVLCHKVACIGASQYRTLCNWGNSDKVELVGVPRFDHLHFANQKSAASKPSTTSESSFKILVMTAKCPGFTDDQRQAIRQSLVDLKNWIQSNTRCCGRKIEITWRLTGDLSDDLDVTNQLHETSGKELASLISEVDAVITTPSTGQLESMLLEKPTAILDYTNSPSYVDAAWKITAKEHFQTVISQLADPPESKTCHQQLLLDDALVCDGGAADRMEELISSMLREARNKVDRKHPLEFTTTMIEGPSTGQNPLKHRLLDHNALYAEHDCFEIEDKTELQAELGHARREIKHLLQQINSLHDELNEAHQIFQQIHTHPIAGPVVRTRQKLIDWMTHFRKKNVEVEPANPTH